MASRGRRAPPARAGGRAKGRVQPAAIAEPDPDQTGIEDDAYPWNTEGYGNNAYRPLGTSVTVELDGA